jgi:hypothetical protein
LPSWINLISLLTRSGTTTSNPRALGTTQKSAGPLNPDASGFRRCLLVQLASAPEFQSTLAARWHDLMDLDAGRVATGEMLVEEARQALFGLLIDVASGLAVTAADRLSLYNDLTLFNLAPVI